MKYIKFLVFLGFFGAFSCTDLDEKLNDKLSEDVGTPDVASLLQGAYGGLRNPFQDQSRFWAAQQHTSDETLGPTRGPDWDDNGIWRVLHDHTWTAEHAFLEATFNELLQIVYTTTNILRFNPTPQQAAESRFLRAWVMFCVADGWGQVPFRDVDVLDELAIAPEVFNSTQALDFLESELNAILNDLPDGPVNRANKDAAKFLLMKIHLNRGTFADRAAPKFENADMQEVINLADDIINSGKYSIDDNYYDNFAPKNDQLSSENIWTAENVGGVSSGNVRSRWFLTLHYNQNPSGWNGFATLSDFYDSFEDSDIRKGAEYAGMTEIGGIRAGFLIGQQFDQNGTALKDRKGNDLAFTREVALVEAGNDLEVTGIRVIKYPIDYNSGDNADNDYVYFRYADVLLMKAEALLRSGNAGAALDIVNDLRGQRSATAFASLNEVNLLEERGREFYWEGWRRQDLIRFGKYLEPFQGKPETSGPERLLFPIPASALAVNPNLAQNPGY